MKVPVCLLQVGSNLFFSYLYRKFNWFFCFVLFFVLFFLAVLGLLCCAWAFSSCGERGYSSLRCAGFSLRWLLLLWSMGSRRRGYVVAARRL